MGNDVVLLPTYARAEHWRKQRARDGASSLFGTSVTTFDSWIADLWELHGDGRALVSGAMRHMLLRRAFAESGAFDEDEITYGLVSAAAACVKDASGLAAFEQACARCEAHGADGDGSDALAPAGGRVSVDPAALDGLDARERVFLAACARYGRLLDSAGLIEPAAAASWLADHADEVFSQPIRVVLEDAAPLDWRQQDFFARCPRISLETHPAPGADGIGRAPDGVHLRFAFPTGPSAQAGLVADVLRRAMRADRAEAAEGEDAAARGRSDDGSGLLAVVACKDPLALYPDLEEALAREGATVAVQGRKPFCQTAFGCAYMAMLRCLHENPWDSAAFTDVLLSPFSGATRGDAYDFDIRLRQDRIASRDEALAFLRASFEPFSQLEELASDPDADILLGAFEQMVQGRADRSAVWRAEQLAAIACVRSVLEAARLAGLPMQACVDELEHAAIPVSAASSDGALGPMVLVATQDDAAALGPQACRLLIATDLTTADFPVADREDAASDLLSRLGYAAWDDALSQARRCFATLLRLPTGHAVMMRPLNGDDAAETYPCIVLDELIDAYRDDPTASDDIDKTYRLPAALRKGLAVRSEDALFENAVARAIGDSQAVQEAPGRPTSREGVLLARRTSEGALLERACPSPSAIESYMECPQKWFIDRRLSAQGIDEGFGPLEKGTFAHAALQMFYARFQEAGYAKVNAQNLETARACMAEVLDELEAAQPLCEPGSGRLVAATELERREMAAFRDQILAYLDFEAEFLPTWRPAYLEYEIDTDHAVDYAGYQLIGRVDRIDVDDAGHAVVIDYKGSVGSDFAIGGKTPLQMGKVQARIYAQAVKRALGLDVVGALYVTYGRVPQVIGAYDPIAIDAAHLPGIRPDTCACSPGCAQDCAGASELDGGTELSTLPFAGMLDATERIVGEAVARMAAGDVAPNPSSKGVCRYCIAPACGKRGGE